MPFMGWNWLGNKTDSNNTDSLSEEESNWRELCRQTGFSHRQIGQFFQRFHELIQLTKPEPNDNEPMKLTLEALTSIPELKANPLGERIALVFMSYEKESKDMDFETFVKVMAKFMTISGDVDQKVDIDIKRKKKMKFLFNIYDIDGDKYIDENDLCQILSKILPHSESQVISQNAVKMIAEMDFDGDKKVSFKDFCTSMEGIDIDTKFSLPFLKRRT